MSDSNVINYRRRYIPLTSLPHLPFDEQSGRPTFDIILALCDQFNVLATEINSNLPALERAGSNIYSGPQGVAMMYLMLIDLLQALGSRSSDSHVHRVLIKFGPVNHYIDKALKLVRQEPSELRKTRSFSFLNSEVGNLTLEAVLIDLGLRARAIPETERIRFRDLIVKIRSFSKEVTNLPKKECELLNGRAGYVYALLFLRSRIPAELCDVTDLICLHIEEMVQAGTDSAQEVSTRPNDYSYSGSGVALGFPLHYTWHDKEYLGAAHGYLGILQVLCLAIDLFPRIEQDLDAPPNMLAKILSAQIECLYQSCTYPTGNLHSSLPLGSHADSLVHWCHGAPGAILTSCTYLEKAAWPAQTKHAIDSNLVAASQTVKERGCLTRPGLCHGIGGNGIALLRATKFVMDPRLHRRATQYAFIGFKERANLMKRADRPCSLFEGIAGLAVLDLCLIAEQFGVTLKFPCYEL